MRKYMVLSVFLVLYRSVHGDEAVLPGDLDMSAFGRRVSVCPAPYVVDPIADNTCTCGPGWTRTPSGACAQCAAGSYKAGAGNTECKACPEHMTSFEGAQDQEDCLCVPGYSAANGACAQCTAGTYKAFIGNASCVACVENATTMPRATSSADCVCTSGFGRVGDICRPCPVNFYSRQGVCYPCQDNSESVVGAAECMCIAGHFRGEGGTCTACRAGTYAAENACKPCPDAMSSPAGAALCTCNPGFRRVNATACAPCTENYFCPGLDVETACPEHSSSLASSSASTNCVCNAGYFAHDRKCLVCREGFYCAGGARFLCPENSTSHVASTQATDCACSVGFEAS